MADELSLMEGRVSISDVLLDMGWEDSTPALQPSGHDYKAKHANLTNAWKFEMNLYPILLIEQGWDSFYFCILGRQVLVYPKLALRSLCSRG